MKHFLLILLSITIYTAQAQITIDDGDLPHGGDIFLFSNGNPFNISVNDLQQTGANQTWDFELNALSQQYDTSFSMSQVPFIFQASFFGSDYADKLAPDINLGIIKIENNYSFYNYNNNKTKLEQSGGGSYISGLPLPVFYSPRDVVYQLPLHYGDQDSCISRFKVSVPTIGSWKEGRNRVNHVDGWGVLKTPFGDKEVLRMRSEVTYYDTVKIDTPFSLPATPFTRRTVEYKWLAKDGGFPMLQITTNIIFGNETIGQILYQDTLDISGVKSISFNDNFNIYPVPANEHFYLSSKTGEQVETAEIFDMMGRRIREIKCNKQSFINISTSALSAGLYSVVLHCGDKQYSSKISVVH